MVDKLVRAVHVTNSDAASLCSLGKVCVEKDPDSSEIGELLASLALQRKHMKLLELTVHEKVHYTATLEKELAEKVGVLRQYADKRSPCIVNVSPQQDCIKEQTQQYQLMQECWQKKSR